MKKKFSKALFVTFAVMILLTVIGLSTAFAATQGYYTYTVENNEAIIKYVNSAIYGDVTIPSILGGYPVKSIGFEAFYDCDYITSVTIPNTVEDIELYAFDDCDNLITVVIPDSVKNIWPSAFSNCKKLMYINIPRSVTHIAEYTFSECSSLASITIPDSVISIGKRAFENCTSLTNIEIPNSVTKIEEKAFYWCYKLTNIEIPDSVTYIGDYAFSCCRGLTDIKLSESIKNIGSNTFSNCDSLEHITIPNSVTNIDTKAFVHCSNLKSITIGKNVTNIKNGAFENCTSLTKVYYVESETKWDKITIETNNDALINATICFNYCSTNQNNKHNYSSKTIKPATCTTTGTKQFTCTCGDTYTTTIAKSNHTYKEITTTKATLTTNGTKKTVCSNCGYVKSTKTIIYPKTFTLSATSFTYNGNVRHPYVTVKDVAGNVLKKDTDYSVTYASGRKTPGTYNVKVTMKGNYTGTKTLSFKIKPIDISTCTVKIANTSYTFDGKVKAPKVTVTNSYGTKLTQGKHYTVTYAEGRKNAGTYKVTVKMIGNYTGTKTLTFKINPINISTCKVKLANTSYTFDGKVKAPKVTVTNSYGTKLTQGKHYNVTYAEGRKNAGTYKVTVKMIGNYTGTKTLTFKINPIKISTCTVKLANTSFTYDGKVKAPKVTVINSYGTKLTQGTHYTVTYQAGRKNVGTYKVTVTMKGNFTGTKTLTFKINPPATTVASLTAGAKKITVNLNKKTTQVTGYQIQYSTNKDFTNAKTKLITGNSTVKTTLSSLTSAKTYYVRVRTYKTVNNVKYYSGWSAYKYVKTK